MVGRSYGLKDSYNLVKNSSKRGIQKSFYVYKDPSSHMSPNVEGINYGKTLNLFPQDHLFVTR